MKSLNQMCYGQQEASLEEKMAWVELLYSEIQVYKTLQAAAANLPEKDWRPFYQELGKKRSFLLDYLPPLRTNE